MTEQTIEIVGPAGRIAVRLSDWPVYAAKGYRRVGEKVSEAAHQEPAVLEELEELEEEEEEEEERKPMRRRKRLR